MKIREGINMSFHIIEPRRRIITFPGRELSKRYLAGELAFYLSGSQQLEFIAHYSKFWRNISDDHRTVNSCYGYKLFKKKTKGSSQFNYAKNQLLKDQHSRKAVMMIYTEDNSDLDTKDNPCTMYLQFFIRDSQLILLVKMRSTDIWFGASYDIPFFTIVQELMLQHLKMADWYKYSRLELGSFVLNCGSLHLYDKNMDKAHKVLLQPDTNEKDERMPRMKMSTLGEIPKFLKYEKDIRMGVCISHPPIENLFLIP